MNVLTSDFETTISNNGNSFDVTNKAVCLGWKQNNNKSYCYFNFEEVGKNWLTLFDWCIFFNAKFDSHWYRHLGFTLPTKIWCCQIAEFVLSGQTIRFPSLEDTAVKYGLGHKVDVVKLEFWEKGINTDEIPQQLLSDYCCQDVELTYQIYLLQLEQFKQKPQLFKLFKLMCQDLLVLEEMEWNGIKYNPQLCKQRSEELSIEIQKIQTQLSLVYPDIYINFNSGDQLSAFLYGGCVYEVVKEPIGLFKTGDRKGQAKFKNVEVEHKLPRLVEPLKKSETKKEGVYKTDENTLRKLKGAAAKKFVEPLLRLAELEKLVGTYYKGIPELATKMHWPVDMIHGQFNQVVAQTGRLSSNSPNLQNFSGECEDIFISRYED